MRRNYGIIIDTYLNDWSLRQIKEAEIRNPPNWHPGFFRIPLQRYRLPTGAMMKEAIQGWSVGGYFLALKDQQGLWIKKSLWPEEWFDEFDHCFDSENCAVVLERKWRTRNRKR